MFARNIRSLSKTHQRLEEAGRRFKSGADKAAGDHLPILADLYQVKL